MKKAVQLFFGFLLVFVIIAITNNSSLLDLGSVRAAKANGESKSSYSPGTPAKSFFKPTRDSKEVPSGPLRASEGFDNAHIRTNMTIDEITGTIDYGKCNMNYETWYYYKLTGCKGKTFTFLNDTNTHVSPVEYRLVSYKPLNTICANSYEMIPVTGKTYTHSFREDTAYVAWHYVASNDMIDNYIKSISRNKYVAVESIGNSTFFNMSIPLVTVTDKSVPDKDKKVVLMISREDSYEANGSVVVMGAMHYLLSDDPEAAEIRKHMIYKFLPIFSRDGTKLGNTNWPLTSDGSKFVYIPPSFYKNPTNIQEINLFKNWLADWKNSGKTIDIAHSLHNSPYYGTELKFRPGQDPERTRAMQVLVDSMQVRSLTGYRNNTREDNPGFRNYFCQYMYDQFKPIIAMNTHSDTRSVAFPGDLKTVEDLYQDGESFVRGHAVYYGIALPKSVPPFLYCSKVSKYSCSKGEEVTFSVYYKDVLARTPKYLRVRIGKKNYDMKLVEGQKGDYIKGLKYTCTLAIPAAKNDYYIEASNGTSSRRIPETYLQYGPYVPYF